MSKKHHSQARICVRITDAARAGDGAWRNGNEVIVPEETARKWIKAGLAVEVPEQTQHAAVPATAAVKQRKDQPSMSDKFKQQRPGTAKYKSNKTQEEWWLTPTEAAPWVERGDIQPAPVPEIAVEKLAAALNELATRDAAAITYDHIRKRPPGLGKRLKELAFSDEKGRKQEISLPWPSRQKAPLAESGGVTGGYAVTPSYQWDMPISGEPPFIRGIARVMPTHTATLRRPFWRITQAQAAGTSPMYGGLWFGWTPEATQAGEIEPANSLEELALATMSTLVICSNAWLADAADGEVEAQFIPLINAAVHAYEEYAFLQGSGAGQPLGILNSGCTIKVNRQTGGEITFQDYSTILSRLLPESFTRTVFVCSPTALTNLLQLRDGTNRAIAIQFQGSNGRPEFYIGPHRLHVTEKLPPLGVPGDFLAADFAYYDIADEASLDEQSRGIYRSLRIFKSDNTPTYFTKNQTAFVVWQRVMGRPRIDSPVTLQDGSTVCSPFVALN